MNKLSYASINLTFKEIYENFLITNYLYVFSIVRKQEVALTIIKQVFETLFIYDNCNGTMNKINTEITRLEFKLANEYAKNNYEFIKKVAIEEITIPDFLLTQYSFSSWNLQNELTNLIIIYHLIYNMSFSNISLILKVPVQEVIIRYSRIMQRIKDIYKSQ